MSDVTFSIGTESDDAPKRKPGRPPGSTNKRPGRPPAGATQDRLNVERAIASMGSLYEMSSLGLMMIGRTNTATLIAGKQDEWQAANRKAFESSPKLASVIAGVGQTSGVVTFVVTNLTAAVMVGLAFRQETAALKHKAEQPTETGPDITEAS